MADQYGFSVPQPAEPGSEFNPFLRSFSVFADAAAKKRQLDLTEKEEKRRAQEDAARMDLAERSFQFQKDKWEAESKLRGVLLDERSTQARLQNMAMDRVVQELDGTKRIQEELVMRGAPKTPEDLAEITGLVMATPGLSPQKQQELIAGVSSQYKNHLDTSAGQSVLLAEASAKNTALEWFKLTGDKDTFMRVYTNPDSQSLARMDQDLARNKLIAARFEKPEADMALQGILDPSGRVDKAALDSLIRRKTTQIGLSTQIPGMRMKEYKAPDGTTYEPDPEANASRQIDDLTKEQASLSKSIETYVKSAQARALPIEETSKVVAPMEERLRVIEAEKAKLSAPQIPADAVSIEANDEAELMSIAREKVKSKKLKPGMRIFWRGRDMGTFRALPGESGGGEEPDAGAPPDAASATAATPAPDLEEVRTRIAESLGIKSEGVSSLDRAIKVLNEEAEARKKSEKAKAERAGEIEKLALQLGEVRSMLGYPSTTAGGYPGGAIAPAPKINPAAAAELRKTEQALIEKIRKLRSEK